MFNRNIKVYIYIYNNTTFIFCYSYIVLSMHSSTRSEVMGKEAELQVRLPNGRIKCTACARLCEIPEGKTGLCGIRGVANNNLYLYVYGRVIAGHIDPIEKNL